MPDTERRMRRGWTQVGVIAVFLAVVCLQCRKKETMPEKPTELEYHVGLGDPEEIDEEVRPLFASTSHFQEMEEPEPGDWLAEHEEPGQSFMQFRRELPFRPRGDRDTIYVQPIGSFAGKESPALDKLERFTEAYFQTPTKILEPVDVGEIDVTSRENPHSGQKQLLTTDIVKYLSGELPDDGFCMVGITMIDLYPKASWNFVFGQAWPRERAGVYSFARYTGDDDRPILWRSAKVMAHELGHLFGIAHCTYFKCGMNGSNSLTESDSRPIHLCPVDLSKLHWSTGFDPIERYAALAEFYGDAGWEEERSWVESRLELLE